MRIAHIVCSFPPYQGGIGAVAYYLALHLAKKGHEVVVFTPDYDNCKVYSIDPKEFKIKRLRPFIKYGLAAFLPQLLWCLKGFDIIHFHYAFYGAAEIIWLLKKINPKIKLVIHYHNDIIGKGGLLAKFIAWHNKWIMPSILKSADILIVLSKGYVEESLLQKIIIDKKINYIAIPNGVDTDIFYPQEKDKELMRKYHISEDEKILLFVGGLDSAHYFKRLEYLVRAFEILIKEKNLSKIKLVIVGEGDRRPYYENLASELKIEEKIIFVGGMGHNLLAKFYNLSDLFVSPSTQESFGLVLIEAMACKKAVIVSCLPGVKEVVTDGQEGFLFEPQNIEQLSEKIYKLIKDDTLRKKMGENGFKKVKTKYQWVEVVDRFIDIYKNMSSRRWGNDK